MGKTSKVLIIAGAILLVVLFIIFGVRKMSSPEKKQETTKQQSDSISIAIEAFNEQFTQYEDLSAPAYKVRELINKVNTLTGEHTIKVVKGDTKTEMTTKDINSAKDYTIEILSADYDEEGYVKKIRIFEN